MNAMQLESSVIKREAPSSEEIAAYRGGEVMQLVQTIVKKTGYFVHGCTGCTCCQSENFVNGMYDNVDDAMECAARHEKDRTVRSQYSSTGIYTVRKIQYELLSDGRIIIGNRVFDDESIYETGDIAEDLRYSGESLITAGKTDYK